MNEAETYRIVAIIKTLCPAQRWDDAAPEVWHEELEPYRWVDAREAVRNLGRVREFIAPRDVVDEVKRIRNDKINRVVFPPPPPGLTQQGEREWLAARVHAAGDGDYTQANANREGAILDTTPDPDWAALIEGATRRVPPVQLPPEETGQ